MKGVRGDAAERKIYILYKKEYAMPAKPHYRERTKNCNWKLKITLCEERKQNVIPLPHKKTLADAMQAESSRGTGGGG